MECSIASSAVQPCLTRITVKRIDNFQFSMSALNKLNGGKSGVRREQSRVFCTPANVEERFSATPSKDFSMVEESDSEPSKTDTLEQLPNSADLKAFLADSQRSILVRKLSEANQQNRFLKRQLHVNEDTLVSFKRELAVIDLEIQGLVRLAQEIANYDIPNGSRKINGKYVQSHLLSRLEAVQKRLEEQIKDVDAAQLKEVHLVWHGMAESVQVMGSFNGWSEGEHLSPEYTGSYTSFSTTLMLRPGRYEIKFLVDGEWHLSSEFPTVGEGSMQNNLLIVE